MIMKMFFEREFLETYLNQRAKGFMKDMDLGSRLKAAMADPGFDGILLTKLEVLATKPEGNSPSRPVQEARDRSLHSSA